jgi:hypothetical protein
VEDLCNVEQTDDIALVVAYRLKSQNRLGGKTTRTKCLKPLETMSWSASVALVESRVTIGFLVMI